ncbi:unnamed protein product [Dracunculus medinensis]|uniref:GP-PDE domain-containing protein n=1 Tax=Dracunculus medinensis TaxID=318479 RepID=A0A158Q690_DRAME|nr:unnamed protein product [Dracunculus medinensis]
MPDVEFWGRAAADFFQSIKIGGHRGAPRIAPENTLESFEKAYESGVDLIEFDLMLTKDDVVVVMHDDNLLRTCGEPELIASLTIDQIKKKNAGKTFYTSGSGEANIYKIPTLEETVKFSMEHKIKMLFDMISQIANIIAKYNLYDQVIVSSFFPWVSYAVKKNDPKILTGLTWRSYFFSYEDLENTIPRFHGILHYIALFADFINIKLINSILPQFLGVEMLLTNEQDISRSIVRDMLKNNIRVVAWTVNEKEQMAYFINILKVFFEVVLITLMNV